MQAKLAIAFGIIMALWIAFMVYQHFDKEEDTQAHIQADYSRMTEGAQKVAQSGLALMGMAIKNYHRDKSHYPAALGELYPDYIQDKGFIDEVDWQYTPAEKGFRLAKTVDTRTAYIDNTNMSPRIEGQAVKVASRQSNQSSTQTQQSPRRQNASTDRRMDTPQYARLEPSKEREYSEKDLQKMKEKLIQELLSGKLSGSYKLTEDETMPMPVNFSAGKAEELPGHIGDKFLAWKSADGSLGFGNVMYPNLERNLAYQNGEWFRTEQPPVPADSPSDAKDGAPAVPTRKNVTEKYGKTYLTWKDKSGRIGFGNVMYPELHNYLVYQNGKWASSRLSSTEAGNTAWQKPPVSAQYDPDRIIEKFEGTYLSWKNQDGTIGFGNVMYPRSAGYSVYQNGQWLKPDEEASRTNESALTLPGIHDSPFSHASLVEKYKNSLYIWEGPAGTLGFGNVDYPAKDAVPISVSGETP